MFYCLENILEKKRLASAKILVNILVIFAVFLYVFYQLRTLKIGNSDNFTLESYLSLYISAPVRLFDLYLKNPVRNTGFWGSESFPTLISNFNSIGIIDGFVSRHLEFRSIGNISLGNVYGATRRYYSDFGILGVIGLYSLLSTIFNNLYYKIVIARKNQNYFKIIVYAYIFPVIPMLIIDDIFFSELSIGYLFNILFLYIGYLIFYFK